MITTICGSDLYWETAGDGFPLICLHGYGVDHRAVKAGMETVCETWGGVRRIYLDLPGMGKSQTHHGILGSDDMLEVVCQFIDAVVGPDRPFALAGYSYGGYLARGILYQMPGRVKGMLLICPVVKFRRKSRKLPAFRRWHQDPDLPREAYREMDGVVTVQTRRVWEAFRDNILPALDLADPGLMGRIQDTEFSFPVDRCESPYTLPATIIAGQEDVSVGYEDAAGLVKNFSDLNFVVLARAGHLLHFERPDLFRVHLQDWLERVNAGNDAG